jgi:hypothetical protein
MSNPVMDAALDYAALDLPVVTLAEGGKRPTQADWPRQATTDPRKIRARFARGGRNVGLLMGGETEHGVPFCIDIDPRNGGSLESFLRGRAIPPTSRAFTPGGGTHLLFYAPAGSVVTSRTGRAGIRPGVDVLGRGSQVVVEPSRVPAGLYLWATPPAYGIARAPRWLLDELGVGTAPAVEPEGGTPDPRRSEDRDHAALLAYAVGRFVVPGPGHRDREFHRLVCALIGMGLGDEAISSLALDWWRFWHEKGHASEPDPSIVASQLRSGRRAEAEGRITPGGGRCHQLALARLSLSPAQRAAFRTLINREPEGGVDRRPVRLAGGANERALLTSLLLHFTYERARVGPRQTRYRATNGQLQELMASRCGLRLTGRNFWSLLQTYVSTPDRPARKVELLRKVFEGRRERGEKVGRPSEYEISERFAELLELGEPVEAVPLASVALAGREAIGGPTPPEAASEDKRDAASDTEVDTMAKARASGLRLRVEDEADDAAALPLPERAGLVDVLEEILRSGRLNADEVARVERALAESRRRGTG